MTISVNQWHSKAIKAITCAARLGTDIVARAPDEGGHQHSIREAISMQPEAIREEHA